MTTLALGLVLFGVLHFIQAVAPGFRKNMIDRIGEYPWKGLITIGLVVSVVLMVRGWKATIPQLLYLPPSWGAEATMLLVLIGFVLFVAPYQPNNFRRLLRHPQLTGVVMWGVGHLLSNGEQRSVLLFGGITLWAILEILLINRRDGAWTRPEPAPRLKDVSIVVVGVLLYVVLIFTHLWLFGVAPTA